MGPRERVQQLQEEIKQLSTANQVYLKKRSRSPGERFAQQMRGQRLRQIIDELAQIANQKKP